MSFFEDSIWEQYMSQNPQQYEMAKKREAAQKNRKLKKAKYSEDSVEEQATPELPTSSPSSTTMTTLPSGVMEKDQVLIDKMYSSPSGNPLYPLTQGLFVGVSEWLGEPRIHIRAFVSPLSRSGDIGETPMSETRIEDSQTKTLLVPTKRGICLDEEGFHKLMVVSRHILKDLVSPLQRCDPGSVEPTDSASNNSFPQKAESGVGEMCSLKSPVCRQQSIDCSGDNGTSQSLTSVC